MRRPLRLLVRTVAWLLAGALAVAAGGLAWAHLAMRGLGAALPMELVGLEGPDLPVEILVVDTFEQRVPRARVLDARRDPRPGAPYVLGDPAFLLRWADGRQLLIDAGMERDAALRFGAWLERAGADPPVPHGGVAEQVGQRVRGGRLAIVFTHLHVDHTQGIGSLCAARGGAPIELYQTRAQQSLRNFTTRPGAAQIEAAGCTEPRLLPGPGLAPVPGFPGVAVLWAAGHTPGSQVVLVSLRDGTSVRRFAFAGDVANQIDGIRGDVPKPLLYRLLVVPEDDARLGALRRFLDHLEQAGFSVVPSHDLLHLREVGLPFAGEAGRATSPPD